MQSHEDFQSRDVWSSCGQLAVWERLSEAAVAGHFSWRKWSIPCSLSKHDPLTSTTKDYMTELSWACKWHVRSWWEERLSWRFYFTSNIYYEVWKPKLAGQWPYVRRQRCCLFHICVGAPLKDVCDHKALRVWNTWPLESYPFDIRYIYDNDSDAPNESFVARA